MKLIIKMFFSSFKNRNHEIVEIFGSREKTKIVQDECKVCLSQWNLENEVLYLLVNENKKKVCRLLKKKKGALYGLKQAPRACNSKIDDYLTQNLSYALMSMLCMWREILKTMLCLFVYIWMT